MSEQSHMAALLKAVTSQSTDQQKKSDIKFQKNIIIKRKNSKQSELLEQQQTSKKIHISQNSGKKVINEKPQNETENNNPQKDSKKAKKQKNKQENNQQQQFLSNWEQFKQKESNNNQTKSTNNINNNNNNNNNSCNKNNSNNNINNNNLNIYSLQPSLKSFKGPTPIVALDCEMVMCEDFEQGQKHFLARVSIVNYNGHVLLDQYVNPRRKVVNYLTWVSGIKPHHIIGAPSLEDLMPKLKSILDEKIIVGHSIKNDFDVMFYYPASKYIRDIAKFSFLKNQSTGKTLSLKNMNQQFLNLSIQNGQHSSVEDARASMLIYRKFEKQIEETVKNQGYNGIKNRLLNDIKK